MQTRPTFKICNLCGTYNRPRIRRCGGCSEMAVYRLPTDKEVSERAKQRAATQALIEELIGEAL